MAGRPPKPSAQKLAEGNPGKRPLNLDEPLPQAGAPSPPDWLDPNARMKWEEVAPELERIGVLTRIDGAALSAYCTSYARWVRAERVLSEKGETYESGGRHGRQIKTRPEVRIAEDSLRTLKMFAEQLGLTPSARVRLKGAPTQGNLFAADDSEYFN